MFDDFIVRALVAGFGMALVAGPLGCFVVWRRMAYFGDTLSHAGLTGVTLGILFGIDPTVGVVGTGILIGLALMLMQQQRRLSTDTLLGILSHSALSVGLIVVSFMDTVRIDLMGYLFGDILAVSTTDLMWIYGGGAFVLVVLAIIWRPLIAITIDEDMARAEGMPTLQVRLVFLLLIAVTVAIAMKIVGVLLVTALLIIPPAASRRFALSPEGMAVTTVIMGALSVMGGVLASLQWDTPSGPSSVVAAALLFVLSLAAGGVVERFRKRAPAV